MPAFFFQLPKLHPKIPYITPFYISALSDPSFFSFIKQYAGSTLVIEDAEKILMKREMDGENSAISVLLNLCDGILANVLDFRLIISFNTDEKNIDPALLRKGRLFLQYKFDNLTADKTEVLYRELYNQDPPQKEMSLAEIYNSEENGNEPPVTKPMGFL
jgi:SpoVK/Ycf46/Vps4 family AAA+-type ATPase